MQQLAETPDRKSTRLNSSHVEISYAVFCLKKKKMDEYQRIHEIATTDNGTAQHRPRDKQRVAHDRPSPKCPGRNSQHAPGWVFFFNDPATADISALSLQDALQI